AGIEVRPEWLVPGGFDLASLRSVGQDIIDSAGTAFDAVVACNDVAAHRVLEDFAKMGYRVPEDFAVCGFDDIEKSAVSHPRLTTVSQPLAEVSRLAWEELDRLLTEGSTHSHLVPTTAVIRASCGCADETAVSGRTENRMLDLLNGYERKMETFQEVVYDLHKFVRALNRVNEADQLGPVLREWLPRLGVSRFAVLRASDAGGQPLAHVCQWNGLLPTAPPYFAVLAAMPSMAAAVVPSAEFQLSDWFARLSPFVMGLFPLVTGDLWHGLIVLELPRDAGLVELVLQEQMSSAFDRIAREEKFRDTETLRRYAVEVAHEITAPLSEVESAHRVVDARLTKLAEQWMPFVTSLSDRGRRLLSRLYDDVARPHEATRDPATWSEALAGLSGSQTAAENLARLGYRGDSRELRELVQVPEFSKVVAFVAQLSDLPRSTATMGSAARSIANYVEALRRSLL
ncbi:MAG TPA: substrate-binding domain-containing protein, partial [Polyangiaceae bacterium]|nr:substrate-binding domain-containing protein [Polyangiaceae bacterium]